MCRGFGHAGVCTVILMTVCMQVFCLSEDIPSLDKRIAELTPSVSATRTFDNALRLLGYDLDGLTVHADGKKHIRLSKTAELELTFYWQQLTTEEHRYQILVQFSDIVYDERTGLATFDKRDSFGHQKRLPVDVARGVIETRQRQTGAVSKMAVTVTVPHFVMRARETELKVGMIMPDGTVHPSLFLDTLVFDDVPKSPVASTGIAKTGDAGRNLLGNAGFESEPFVNAEGNWTFWNGRGVMQFMDAREARHGVRSLRLDFFGGLDPHVYSKYQDVSVKPDTEYILSWYAKSDRLTSTRGPRLSVYDADKGWEHFVVSGDDVLGVTDWHKKTMSFRTPRDTVKLRVFIDRAGSDDWKSMPDKDRMIAGSAWFDLVQLVEKK